MNPKITVLEKIEMTDEQRKRLDSLGDVEWYDSSSKEECKERVKGADVVLIDWIEPNPFLSEMKNPSLLALMSTGYSWIDNKKAKESGISVTNIPAYATEAVAEHIIGLALSVAKKINKGDRNIRKGEKQKPTGMELRDKTLGIIGLGKIGGRVAEIASCLGMNIITYNRKSKSESGIKDVSLDELLKISDVVCVTCSLNEDSRNMLNSDKLKLMKKDAILVGTTWNVVNVEALIHVLKSNLIYGAGLDVSIEAKDPKLPKELTKLDNITLTPHIAFNTVESKIRRMDICISNIEGFLKGEPKNVVN